MASDVAHVAPHDDRDEIVSDALRTAMEIADGDSAFAAVRSSNGDGYDVTEVSGISEPAFLQLSIKSGRLRTTLSQTASSCSTWPA